MKRNPRLILLSFVLTTLLTACGGKEAVAPADVQAEAFADLRAAVEGAIEDPSRETDVLALLDQVEADVATLRESLVERRAELRRLNANYDTTREELSTYAATMESRIQDNRRQLLEARGRLVAATTEDEWDAITKADTKAMKTIARSMQSL